MNGTKILSKKVFLLVVMLSAALVYALPGDGSELDPYQISSRTDLEQITDLSANYILTADINLSGVLYSQAVIAPDTDSSTDDFVGDAFTGSFNGNGKVISNLTITGDHYLGLFGNITGGEVFGLGIVNADISGDYSIGALAGAIETGASVSDCYSTGSVEGGERVGGLIGAVYSSSLVYGSYSQATVNGGERVGGLIGHTSTGVLVDNCYAEGDVTADAGVGGLIGRTYQCEVTNSYATGDVVGNLRVGGLSGWHTGSIISDCYAEGKVSGGERLGGLVGESLTSSIIRTSSASGDVEQTEDYLFYAGGLVGHNNNSKIDRCFASGNVYGGGRVGGLAGNSHAGIIRSSYSTGNVTSVGADPVSEFAPAGGLVGQNWYSVIADSYAEGNVNGVNRVGALAGNSTGGRIDRCFAIGEVVGVEQVGGLVGRMTTFGVISNSYALGDVTADVEGGGLVGELDRSYVINSYAAGKPVSAASVGGLVAFASSESEVINSFWDTTVSSVFTSQGGVGRTTSQMQDPATFQDAGWGFYDENQAAIDESWLIPADNGYMILASFEGKSSFAGSGTEQDPYRIYNREDLERISGNLIADYELMNDIDLSDVTYTASVIDPNDPARNFMGSFDGKGYSIKNLKIDAPEENYVGLFNRIGYRDIYFGGSVSNLTIENPDITGNTNTGALAGYIEKAFISDIQVISPEVNGGNFTGSLVGEAIYSSVIDCSASDVTVMGGSRTGGLIGQYRGDIVDRCSVTGNSFVSGSGERVAGLIGNTWGWRNYVVPVYNSYSEADVTGPFRVGGLVGHASTASHIENCYATGDIITPEGTHRVGGLIGNCHGPTHIVTVINSYATGNVVSPTGEYVGGLIGQGYIVDVTNCFATGNVTGLERVGGLVGQNHTETVLNSFATGDVKGVDMVGGLVGNNTTNNAYIINSYSTGNVSVPEGYPQIVGERMGGLSGRNSEAHIVNSYSIGSASGYTGIGGFVGSNINNATIKNSYSLGAAFGTENVGGFVGSNEPNDFQIANDCFWNTETSGTTQAVGGEANDAGITGLTTEQMLSSGEFLAAGWDFGGVWFNCEGFSYPRLSWQQFNNADINLDGIVDSTDLSYLSDYWLQEVNGLCVDINSSGNVDLADYAILASQWLFE